MLRARLAEVVAISTLATIVTVVIAVPVLRAPSERVFGMETMGRHHDPFTMMAQFERPITIGMYSQPVTDLTGALFARIAGAVAAYNWLVLLSFPLSAAATYLLARYLALSPIGAAIAAMAYAFSPFHLAHAAYHPHIAQTQWMPLYLLALWHCLDEASPAAAGLLGMSALAVTLSNFYGGLIAAVITPVAIASYWLPARTATHASRNLFVVIGTLGLIGAGGLVYASYVAGALVANPAMFAFSRAELFHYSARWWSYLVPPVEHPLLGAGVRRLWEATGVSEGLLEQQVSLGWGVVALGLTAVFRWARHRDDVREAVSLARVPLLVMVAVAALVCSLSPERVIGGLTILAPSALLYSIAPMFRAYARFGVVVQLMAALLAGAGVDYLLNGGRRRLQAVCVGLVALAGAEYAVAPSGQWRDVLPTSAHRWVARQPPGIRALDCMPVSQESESIQWLTDSRVTLLERGAIDCMEPQLSSKLAAAGYSHLVIRRNTPDGRWFAAHPAPDGLRVAAQFGDGQVLAVTLPPPALYTAAMTGFFLREHDTAVSWRWMSDDASWTVVNTRARPLAAAIGIEMAAFHHVRELEVLLDAQVLKRLAVDPSRRVYRLDPITVPPGYHQLRFHPIEPPTVAAGVIDNGDRRRLSFALGGWNWTVQGEHQ